jgi:hypothetical protein
MQDKYVGDINDYYKFLFLDEILPNNTKLGINWFYHKIEREDNNDGKKSIPDYIEDKFSIELKKIYKSIKSLEKCNFYGYKVKFYSEVLEPNFNRNNWFSNSRSKLNECDVIFCDPDNGIEVASYGVLNKIAHKFIYINEIEKYYEDSKNIIIYQHLSRMKFEKFCEEKVLNIINNTKIKSEEIEIFYNEKKSVIFIVINNPNSNIKFNSNIKYFSKFQKINLK